MSFCSCTTLGGAQMSALAPAATVACAVPVSCPPVAMIGRLGKAARNSAMTAAVLRPAATLTMRAPA